MPPIRLVAALAVFLCITSGWSATASADASPAKTSRPAAEVEQPASPVAAGKAAVRDTAPKARAEALGEQGIAPAPGDLQVELQAPASAEQPLLVTVRNLGSGETRQTLVDTNATASCEAGKLRMNVPLDAAGVRVVPPLGPGTSVSFSILPEEVTWTTAGCMIEADAGVDKSQAQPDPNRDNNQTSVTFCPADQCY